MPKKYSDLPKLPKQTQPSKALGPGSFGPVIAPKPGVNAPFGPIVAPKTKIPKEPKITRKPGKPIKGAPASYL